MIKEQLDENLKKIDVEKIKQEHSEAIEDFNKMTNKELLITLGTFGFYFLWKRWQIKGAISFIAVLMILSFLVGGSKEVKPFVIFNEFESTTESYGFKTSRDIKTKIEYKDNIVKVIEYGKRGTNQIYRFNVGDLTKIDVTENLPGSTLESGKLKMTYWSKQYSLSLFTKPDKVEWQTAYKYSEDINKNKTIVDSSFVLMSLDKKEDVNQFIEKMEILNPSIEIEEK